jgi:hypothetical protein
MAPDAFSEDPTRHRSITLMEMLSVTRSLNGTSDANGRASSEVQVRESTRSNETGNAVPNEVPNQPVIDLTGDNDVIDLTNDDVEVIDLTGDGDKENAADNRVNH